MSYSVKRIRAIFGARFIFVLFALIMPLAARAGDDDSTLAQLLTKLVMAIIEILGKLLAAMVSMIVKVSEYNDFINALAVVNGWVIVRDVANMFFIVVLLIIAFGTILGQEDYHYKKLLPKMLLLAVFVNFSRTIVGVMIDFAQVIMLTFVNGYKAAAGGNFAQAFQIVKLLQFSKDACVTEQNPGGSITDWGIFAAALLALIMVVVSIITVAVILAVLVLRIITLWLLTVLSPIAFLCGAFPQGQKYYTQWWEEFKNMVMVGPMLAFFLWLSLISVGSMNSASQLSQGGSFVVPEDEVKFACSAVGNTQSIMSFILGTMMLLAGVQMAQQMGGAIAGIASQAKGAATRALKFGAKALAAPVAFGAGYGLKRADDLQARLQQKLAKSKLGAKLFSPDLREKLSEHGVALRTIPAAWKLRGQRVEKERLGESMAVAYDLMNRYMPLRRSKSDFTEIERGGDVKKIMDEVSAGGTDKERLIHLLLEEDLDKNGNVKYGREKFAEAKVLMMTQNHDFNELLKDPTLSKMLFKSDTPMAVTPENAAELVVQMFGKGNTHSQEALRVLNKVGDMGLKNNDPWLYRISEKDVKTGEYKLNMERDEATGKWTPESIGRHAEIAAVYTAKLTARNNSQNARGQNVFVETADKDGNRVFTGEIHAAGEQWLLKVLPALTGHLQYLQPEFVNAVLPNLDKLFDFSQRSDLSEYQRTGIEALIKKLTGSKDKMPSRDEVVNFAMQSRDETSYQQISDSRGETYEPKIPSDLNDPTAVTALTSMSGKSAQSAADALQSAGRQAEAGLLRVSASVANAAARLSSVVSALPASKVGDIGAVVDSQIQSAVNSHQAAMSAYNAAVAANAPQQQKDSLQSTVNLADEIKQAVENVGNQIKQAASIAGATVRQSVAAGNATLKQYANNVAQSIQAQTAAARGTGAEATVKAAAKVIDRAVRSIP